MKPRNDKPLPLSDINGFPRKYRKPTGRNLSNRLMFLSLAMVFCFSTAASSDSGLFQYAVWRSNDRIVNLPYVDGVVAYLHWNVLERQQGDFDLEPIRRIRNRAQQEGKRFILRIVTADHSPVWLYRLGVPRVMENIDGRLRSVPLYWHPVYLQSLGALVKKIGEHFDGDPHLAAVQMGVGTYGEMLLGGREWMEKGFSNDIWTDTCRKIIDIYRDSFKKTPLIVMIMSQEFPGNRQTAPMTQVAEYAASNDIGLQFNGLSPDNSYLWGLMDKPDEHSAIGIMRQYRSRVPLYFELTSDKVDARLSCLNALSERASFIFIHTSLLEDPSLAPVFEFTRHFLGHSPNNSDAVWSMLRQTFPADSLRTGKKNYDFGMELFETQDANVLLSDGATQKLGSNTTAIEELNGLPCRKTNGATNQRHMLFKIAQDFDTGKNPTLTVFYADVGHDTWFPMYSVGKTIARGGVVKKNNTSKWLKVEFTLEGFAKGSPIDIVIDSNDDGDEFISFVQLTRDGTRVLTPFPDVHATP